jgi:hypothetical protein
MNTQPRTSTVTVAPDPLERLGNAIRARASIWTRRSFAVLRVPDRAQDEEAAPATSPATELRTRGRHYALALVALVDALAAEPSHSPLATGASLDDVRTAAFAIAAETAAATPDLALVERALVGADRRLSELRVPLRVTGYLVAREGLQRALELAHREARS